MSMPLGWPECCWKEEKSFLKDRKKSDQVLGRIMKQWSSHASLHISSTDMNHMADASLSHVADSLMVCGYKLDAEVIVQGGTSNLLLSLEKNPADSLSGTVKFVCLLLCPFFSFISFSENSLTSPGHCYTCCLIATHDETRPWRPQQICYLSRLKLYYCEVFRTG